MLLELCTMSAMLYIVLESSRQFSCSLSSCSHSREFQNPLASFMVFILSQVFQELPSHFNSLIFLRFPPVRQFGLVKLAGRDTRTAQRLQGKVAVITGGASGIGETTERHFVRHGAKVIVADIQDDLGHFLCADINSQETVSFIHCDVTNESDIQNVVDTAIAKHGKLGIMFNNAGISGKIGPRIVEADCEDFKRVFDANFFGAFLGAKHAARVMIPAKKGTILFTSSMASVTSGLAAHDYTTSKHAIVGLTKNFVSTPLTLKNTPLVAGREGKQKAEAVLSEAGNLKEVVLESEDDESKYVSGVNLVVDGSYSLTNPAIIEAYKKFVNSFCIEKLFSGLGVWSNDVSKAL
ncbi:unnamed protein product [Camellia sinensis]